MGEDLYQLHVSLIDAMPAIWRRLLVRSNTSLRYLHYLLQGAMGWTDSHLYEYEVGRDRFGEPDEDAPASLKPAADFTLGQVAPRVGAKFIYVYDFGDEWNHAIEVEAITPAQAGQRYPVCVDGARSCPPEDFGGAFAYSAWLRAMESGKDIDLDALEEYPGFDFDPDKFSVDTATRHMRRVESNARYRTWG